MECKFNPFLDFLHSVDNYHLCTIIISFALALFFKNKRWAILTGVTTFFYYIGYITLCDVIKLDTDKVWRYAVWAGWDALWMLVVFKTWDKKLVYQYQAVAAVILGFAGVCLQAFRHIDRHYFELAYSTSIYQTMAPTFNNLLVLVCLYPTIAYFKKGIAKWQSQ